MLLVPLLSIAAAHEYSLHPGQGSSRDWDSISLNLNLLPAKSLPTLPRPVHQSMQRSSPSDDSDDGARHLPAGVLRSRGGWADMNGYEVEHQRERLRRADDHAGSGDDDVTKTTHAAVDLSQFRNEEVGKGYKAKHVVRQRDVSSSVAMKGVVDMSGGAYLSTNKRCQDQDDVRKKGEKIALDSKSDVPCFESYLRSKGVRDFIKEIDKILKQR